MNIAYVCYNFSQNATSSCSVWENKIEHMKKVNKQYIVLVDLGLSYDFSI